MQTPKSKHMRKGEILIKSTRRYTLVEEEYVTKQINEHSFEAHLLTVCVYSHTEHEPQGGEPMSAELDD